MATKELKKKNKRMNLTPWMTNAGTRKAHPDEGGPGVRRKIRESCWRLQGVNSWSSSSPFFRPATGVLKEQFGKTGNMD